jgi:hypothetical protein
MTLWGDVTQRRRPGLIKRAKEFIMYMNTQCSQLRPEAKKQTLMNNSRTAMEKKGVWVEFTKVLKVNIMYTCIFFC